MNLLRAGRSLRPWLIAALIGFTALQLVPYGWRHENPPVTERAPWPSEQARSIAAASCLSCHSNETDWPWYSYIAPMSWLIRRDVEEGREDLNFSTWDRDDGRADDAIESILDGDMPPRRYVLVNPGARLSSEEERALVDALRNMDR